MATNLFIFWISKFCIKSLFKQMQNEGNYAVCRANFTHNRNLVRLFIASCIFQFRAFHVICTPFIFYLFFNIRGNKSSFMRLSFMLFLFTVTCLKPFLQSICAINAFGFCLSSCHTFDLFLLYWCFPLHTSFSGQSSTQILSPTQLVPSMTFR